jgi:hypothetical protein
LIDERSSGKVAVVESVYMTQLKRPSTLTLASCDSSGKGVVIKGGEEVEGYNWKGSLEEKESCVDRIRKVSPIVLVESARTTTVSLALPEEPVIVVVCPGEVLGKHLRARCEKKGKKFREDYWDEWKLSYESSRRYINFASKNLRPEQYKVFQIEDQARDWLVVDAYFGSIYRKMNNELNRRKSS